MKLSKELNRLEDMTRKLHMTLCGLRVPEALEGAMDYARDEAEKVNGLTSWLAGKIERGEIPDAEAGFIPDIDGKAQTKGGGAEKPRLFLAHIRRTKL